MEKKDKKSGKHGRGLDTIGKRILVLTIAILMTFQFCTPTFYGISFADEEGYLEETEQPVDEQAVEPAETPEEEVQAEEPQGEAADPVLDEAVTEEPADEVPADTVDEQEEPAAPEEVEPAEPAAEEPAVEPTEEEPQYEEPAEEPQYEEPAEEQPAEEPVQDEEQTEEPAPEEKPEEVAYPAQNFDDTTSLKDVEVHVVAPEGALPEGTTMTVKNVGFFDMRSVKNAVAEEMGSEAKVVKAVDITFFDKDGNEVQPTDGFPLQVSMNSAEFADLENPAVVHIDDSKSAEVVTENAAGETSEEVVFDAEHFSVYVVVDQGETGDNARLTVNFVNGETPIASMQVKKADLDHGQLETVLYDPGVGSLGATQVFRGWTTKQSYTAEDVESGLNIDAIRTEVENKLTATGENAVHEGDTVTYYALVYDVFNVTYKAGDQVVLKNDAQLVVPTDDSVEYTILESYTPPTQDQDFKGWFITPGTNATLKTGEPVVENQAYPNGTEIILSGSIVLTVDAPTGHWLIFKENGKNVSYTAPQFLESGQVTQEPDEPTRLGYQFEGWYTDEACTDGNEFTFGSELQTSTTLYAKWEANPTAPYTVIIWKQNVSGDGYDFDSSKQLTGNTGTNVDSITATGTGDGRYATINGTTYQWTGFHLDRYDQNVEVKPEGTSVVNVYYNRNQITLNFYTYRWNNGYTQHNQYDEHLEYYGRQVSSWSGYTYFRIYYYEGNWLYQGNDGYYYYYNGNRYIKNGSWNTTPYKTTKGLYGANLAENGFTWPSEYDWYDEHYDGGSVGGTRTTFLDAYLPTSNSNTLNFYATTSGGENHVYFYKQNADGNGYTLANDVAVLSNGFNLSDKYNGFTCVAWNTTNDTSNWNEVGELMQPQEGSENKYYDADPDTEGYQSASFEDNLYIYFNRNTYNISFQDGVFVDGNGNGVEGVDGRGQFREVTGITLGADVSSYNEYIPTYNGFVFAGWYVDDTCTQEFTFDTMPEGLVVYAKWSQVQYRVFLHPNVPTSEPDTFMGGQATSFRVDYGAQITSPNPVREDYELVGWYTDNETFKNKFYFDAYSLNDNTVTDEYDKTRSTETDNYGNVIAGKENENSDVNRPWITRSLDLYAQWRSKLLGAEGINVVYDLNGGTGGTAQEDHNLYKDLSYAVAVPASTAPTASNPKDQTVFSHWVVQKWNGTAFEDTDETVLPGDTFQVLKSSAQIVENGDSTPQNPSYTYTVKLKAEYAKAGHETMTHITWYANNGTSESTDANTLKDGTEVSGDNVPYNASVQIKPADTFTYAGHTFVGWAKKHTTDSAIPTEVNFLWYDGEKFYSDAEMTKEATHIAADEGQPYDDLYAIWAIDVEVEVEGSSVDKVYNGSPQSNTTYTVKYKVNGEYVEESELPNGITCTVTATQDDDTVDPIAATGTDVGTYTAKVTATLSGSAAGYYIKTPTDSDDVVLEITPAEVTLTANSDLTKVYNGSEQSVTGFTASVDGLTFEGVTASASGTNAGTYTVSIEGVTINETKDSTGNYVVTEVVDGTMKISPAPLTITAIPQEYPYNGTPQGENNDSYTTAEDIAAKVEVTGLQASDELTGITLNGQETDANVYENKIAPSLAVISKGETSVTGNYTITYSSGTLTITPLEITIKADNKTKVYDNDASTDPELTATVTGVPANGVAPTYTLSRELGQDVDEYDITVTAAADANPNYTVTVEGGTFTITPAEIKIKADNKTKVYDNNAETDPELTATVTGVPTNGVAPVYSLSREEGQDVDEYAITVTAAADANPNYTVTVEGGTFTITPAEIKIKADDKTKAYDNDPTTDPALTATVTGVPTNGVAPVYSLSREEGQDVDEYDITVTAASDANPNYTVTVEGGTFTITPAEIKIKADNKTKVYDNDPTTDPALTATVTGKPANGATPSYTLSREPGQDVDEYDITVTVEEGSNPNYTVTVEGGTFTITPAEIKIKADDKTKAYDNDPATDPELTATVTGKPANGVTPSYTLSREPGQDVDEYDITVTVEEGSNPNYTVTVEGGTFKIEPVEITIKADNKTKVYDNDESTDPELTATITGVPENGIAPTYTLSREPGQDADEYDITVTLEEGSNPNYTVSVEGGTFTITPAQITITADNKTKVYDNDETTDPELTATVTGVPTSGVAPVYSLSREEGQDVDEYDITVTAAADANPNYTVTVEGGTFTITPAEITITADNKTKVYDNDETTDPELTATVTGVPTNGVAPVYSLSREEGQDVDEYDITVTAAADANPNYTVTVEGGTFTITPAEITIKADDKTKAYDNDPTTDPALTATVTGVPTNGVAPVYSLSREEGQDVDEYDITVTAAADANPNYTVTVEGGTFTITPAEITIKADDKTKVYDNNAETDPELTATVTGVPTNGVAPVYSLSREEGQDVDEYAITVTAAADANPNYTVTVEGGTFTITPAEITIKADDKTKAYDNDPTTDPALTATVTGVPTNGVAPVYSLSREEGQDVDEYDITVTAAADANPNYTVTVEGGTFTITPIDVTVTITGATNTTTYDGNEHVVTGYTAEASTTLYDVTKDFTFTPAEDADLEEGVIAARRTVEGTTNMGLAPEQFANTNPNFGTVTFNVTDGYQTITPIDEVVVTITGASNTTTYDGNEHVVTGYTAEASTTLYDVTKDFTFTPAEGADLEEDEIAARRTDVGTTNMGLDASQFANTNRNFKKVTFNVTDGYQTIDPAAITITADNKTKVYDNDPTTDPELTATVTGVPTNGVAPVYSLSREEGQDVDEYDITVTAAADANPNYTVTVEGGTFTITPAQIKIKADDKTKAYDNDPTTDPELTATVTGVPTNGVAPVYSLSREEGQDVDEYDITVTAAADANPNYTVTVEGGTFTITPAQIKIKADDKTKAYDNDPTTDPALTATVTGVPTNGVAPVYSLSREEGQDVDEYDITVTAAADANPNYTVTVEGGTFTITPIDVTVTITGATNTTTYDGNEHVVTGYTAEASTTLYDVTKDFTFTPAEDADLEEGVIAARRTVEGTTNMGLAPEQFANTNPNFGTVTFNVTDGYQTITPIDEVVVTITGASNTTTYDGNEHVVTGYTAEASTTLYDVTKDFTFTPAEGADLEEDEIAARRTDVGTTNMGLDASQFANTNRNFKKVTFNVTDGYQTIDPAAITITADNKTKVYDNDPTTDPELTATVTGVPTNGVAPVYSLSREEGQDVDEYDITVTAAADANPNYTVTVEGGTFTITPAQIKIKADDKTKVYDNNAETDPELTATVTGVPTNGVAPVYSLSREEGQDVDEYDITVTAAADANPNYTVTVEGGTFTITPAQIKIKADDKTKAYDNDPTTDPALTATVTGVPTNGVAPVYSLSREEGQDVDEYDITVTAAADANPNYTVTVEGGTFTITPAQIKIKADDKTKAYDNDPTTDPALTATVTGVPTNGVAPVYSLSREEGQDVDEYDITVTAAADANPNYTVTVEGGTFTITPIDVTVTITGATNTTTYDGNEHVVTGYTAEASTTLYDVTKDFTFTPAEDADLEEGVIAARRTVEGTTNMGLAPEQFANTNPNFGTVTFNVTDGYQTIIPIDEVVVTITGHTSTVNYDGEEHTVTGYDVEISNELYKESDFTFTGSDEAKRTDAGTTNMGLAPEQFKNNNTNFAKVTFNVTDGYQKIDPINVTVTIVGNNNTTDYDGAEHKVTGYTATASTPLYKVSGENVDFTFSGTAEAKRTDVGQTNMGLKADQFENKNPNFATVTFNVTDGYQKIDPIDVIVTIVGNNNTTDYDGAEHKVTGYTATANTDLYDVTKDFTFSGTAEAKRTDAGQTNMNLTAAQFANTNTNFKTVTFNVTDGFQTINPIDVVVTIVGANNTTDYDGEAHTVTGYTATANTNLYKVTGENVDFTFSGTATATRTDAGTTNMGLAASQFSNTNTNFANVTFNVTDGYQTINPINVTVTITGHNNTADYDGEAHTVTGYDVTISDPLYTENDFTFSGTATATRTDAGTTNMGLAASQFTNTNANFATVTFNVTDGYQTITPIDVVVTIVGANNSTVYDGAAHTVTGYTATANTDLYKVTGENVDFTFSGTATATRTDVGTTNMGLAANQFTNTNTNFATVTFNVTDGFQQITPVDVVTVTITGHNNTTDYDGTAHTVTGYDVTISDPLYTENDFTFSGEATATRTDVGTTNMGLAADQFANTNNNFASVVFNVTDGYQKIEPIDVVVTIVGNNNTANYDGEAHTVTGYTATANTTLYDVAKDFTFSGTATATRTDAGQTDMGLKAEQFTNTNSNFKTVTFNVTDGFQKIEPIDVTVTITGHHNTATYDSNEHVVTGYDVEISNPLYKEADFTFTPAEGADLEEGVIAARRTDAGQTDMGLKAEQFANKNTNFKTVTFDVTDGYQAITPVDEVVVTITGHHNTTDYDGKEHVVTGYDVEISDPLYKETDFTFSGTAEAKRTDAGQTDMGLKAEQFTNNNGNFAKVTFNVTDGYQKINKINAVVTITGHNNTTDYDGQEHVVTGYDVEISTPLYTEADFTFSGTAEAKRTNAGQTDMGLAAAQFSNTNENFETVTFNVTDGYQKINKINAVVTITGHNNTTDYDGQEHVVTGYDIETSTPLYTEADFTFSGTAEAKRTNAGQTDMGLAAAQFSNTNENFETVTFNVTDGFQKINKINATVTITGHNNTTDYDGQEHVVTGYDVETSTPRYTEADFTFSGTAEAKRTNAGQTDMGLAAAQFSNTNENFETVTFNVTDGFQKIEPIDVTVTITGHNNTCDYDGNAHTVTGYDFAASTPLYTEADFTFSGTAEATGTNAGQYNMELKPEQFTNNNPNFRTVTFNVTDGFQKIEQIDATVTITGHNNTTVYDGQKHTVTGYDVETSTPLYTEADFTFSGTAEASRTNVVEGDDADGQTDMGLAEDQFANTNNNFRTVTFVVTDGFQKITPVTEEVVVTITGNAEEATYDGKEHTVTGYEVEISNDLYTEDDFKFNGNDTASRTYVAEGEDESGVTMMGMTPEDFENLSTNFTNITFVVNDGSMTIDKRPITLTSEGATKPYDGTALEKKVVDISGEGLAEGDDITYLPDAWGSQTLVGSSDNTFDYEFVRVAKKGVVANVLSALGILDEAGAAEIVGHEVNDIEKNYDVTVEFGTLEVTDKGADPDDVLTKTHEDKSYKVGETITFTIEVTNIYDEAKTITLEEMKGVTLKQSVFEDVPAGETVSTTATYTVTEEDALAGTFTNTVKATYSGEDEPFSNDDTVDMFAHMTVTKTVTNKPADGEVFRTGETIKYEITVTNDGTQTLTDVVVKDELTGDEWKIDKLAAGKTKTFKAEYIVTEADGVSGSVTNVATAQGNDPDGDDTPGVEGKVTTKTDKANEPTVPKTGDNTPIVEFSVIFGASVITLLMMLFRRKKERA